MNKNLLQSTLAVLLHSQVFIVAVDQNIHTEFKSHLSKALSETFESGKFVFLQ